MRRTFAFLALAAVVAVAASGASAATKPHLQHITFLGDSVAGSITFEPTARLLLTRDNQVDFELAACRRLATPSCYVTGMSPPPTAFDTLRQLGSAVGPNVVVDVGYNDDSNDYRQGMIRVLALLGRKGVHHVVWLTLREHWHDYITINDEIRAVARTRPWVTVADWNRYSRSHPDWYQSDGIHLEAAGAAALAVFVHRTLARLRLTGAPHVTKIRTRRVASARRAKPRALRAADTSAQAGSTSDVGPVAALIGLLVVISAAAYARVRRSRRRERERRRRERRLRASRTA